jgi:hypothetical protein
MEKLIPEAKQRLEEKIIAVNEVFVELVRTDRFKDVDQQIKSAISGSPSQKWIIGLLLYYSEKIQKEKILNWYRFFQQAGGDAFWRKTSEEFTMIKLYGIIAAKAGDIEGQKYLKCL